MDARRARLLIDEKQVLTFKQQVILRFDDRRQVWVLLAPEHIYWPDDIAVAILKKIDGSLPVGAMIDELATEYAAPRPDIANDVKEFLQEWADQRLVRLAEAA